MALRLTLPFPLSKVGHVRSALHWFLALLLVVAPIMSSAAYAGASTADAPCPMTASDDVAHSPCTDCGDPAASCAQVCAMLGAGILVSPDRAPSLSDLPAERIASLASDAFRSRAGPPGLQPPR